MLRRNAKVAYVCNFRALRLFSCILTGPKSGNVSAPNLIFGPQDKPVIASGTGSAFSFLAPSWTQYGPEVAQRDEEIYMTPLLPLSRAAG